MAMNRERRTTSGRRMTELVGKALEEDQQFYNNELWKEGSDSSDNESFHAEEEEKDEFDSDFNDTEDDEEEEEEESTTDRRSKARPKSSFLDMLRGFRKPIVPKSMFQLLYHCINIYAMFRTNNRGSRNRG